MTTNSPTLSLEFDRWITESWHTDKRYYGVEITRDLFGMWVLRRTWGGLTNQRRNSKSHAFAHYEEALKFFTQVAKQRRQRGYVLED